VFIYLLNKDLEPMTKIHQKYKEWQISRFLDHSRVWSCRLFPQLQMARSIVIFLFSLVCVYVLEKACLLNGSSEVQNTSNIEVPKPLYRQPRGLWTTPARTSHWRPATASLPKPTWVVDDNRKHVTLIKFIYIFYLFYYLTRGFKIRYIFVRKT
jgi:hypothetical protein